MARSYNIIDRLNAKNERPFVAIAEGKSYTINTSKTTALKFVAIQEDESLNNVEKMDKMVEAALGKKALNEIEKMELSLPAYEVLFEAITAALAGEEMEEVKERFQESEQPN